MNCPYCNNQNNNPNASVCEYCGAPLSAQTNTQPNYQQQNFNQPNYQQQNFNQPNYQQNMYQNNSFNQYSQPYQPPVYQAPPIYCHVCGNTCDPKAAICVRCGSTLNNTSTNANDIPSGGLKLLSFLIPLVGLILFISKNSTEPKSAKAYGKFALIGWILGMVVSFFFYFIMYFFSYSYYF